MKLLSGLLCAYIFICITTGIHAEGSPEETPQEVSDLNVFTRLDSTKTDTWWVTDSDMDPKTFRFEKTEGLLPYKAPGNVFKQHESILKKKSEIGLADKTI